METSAGGEQVSFPVQMAATGAEIVRVGFGEDVQSLILDERPYDRTYFDEWKSVPLQPARLIEIACSRLGRNLSEADWRRYLRDAPYRKTCPELPDHGAYAIR